MNDYAIQGLVQIILVGIVVLVPVTGITVRFMLRPFIEAGARKQDLSALRQENALLEKRMGMLEHQLESIERGVDRLLEAKEFDQELGTPTGAPRLESARHRA